MAYILKKKKQNRIINKISEEGKEIVDKSKIKATFLKFYSRLYKGKYMEMDKIQDYFNNYKIKKLTKDEKDLMEELITEEEIEAAVDRTKTGKALGPDGFTAKFNYYNGFRQ